MARKDLLLFSSSFFLEGVGLPRSFNQKMCMSTFLRLKRGMSERFNMDQKPWLKDLLAKSLIGIDTGSRPGRYCWLSANCAFGKALYLVCLCFFLSCSVLLQVGRLPLFETLCERLCSLCYERAWYAKNGGSVLFARLFLLSLPRLPRPSNVFFHPVVALDVWQSGGWWWRCPCGGLLSISFPLSWLSTSSCKTSAERFVLSTSLLMLFVTWKTHVLS